MSAEILAHLARRENELSELMLGHYGVKRIDHDLLHARRRGKGKAGLGALRKNAAKINLAIVNHAINRNAGHQVRRRGVLLDGTADAGSLGSVSKLYARYFELRKRDAIHPAIEEPIH